MRIELLAQQFRDAHAPGAHGHLDLDPIVEFKLKIQIVVRKNLQLLTGKPGYLTENGREIYVDEDFQLNYPDEYQSFLAHEISHLLLHRGYLPKPPYGKEQFLSWHQSVSDERYAQLEWEARTMGLMIQMPETEFRPIFAHLCALAEDRFTALNDVAATFIGEALSDHFGVSPLRAQVRMDRAWKAARRLDRIDRDARRSIQPHSVRMAEKALARVAARKAARATGLKEAFV